MNNPESFTWKVYKYPLALIDEPQVIEVPSLRCTRGKVVMVGLDPNYDFSIWIIACPGQPPLLRSFVVEGTGHPIAAGKIADHVGSVRMDPFIWHVFELLPYE
jgi:hypothetical protein